jgi:choline transport protein
MSEEIKRASVIVTRSTMASMALNGAFGFGILLASLFALRNIDASLGSPAGLAGYVFLDILQKGTNSVGGIAGMGAIISFMQIFSNIANMVAASRI